MAACQFSGLKSPQVPLTKSTPAVMSQSTFAIGIDLGTTYSCVAVYIPVEDKVEILDNTWGYHTTPSQVAFNDDALLIGEDAKDQAELNLANTVFDSKRLIGRRFDDPTVQSDMKHWPFKVVDESGKPKIEVEYKGETKRFSPEEISSMILTKLKEFAEEYLGQTVTDAVISVPAYFTNAQRQATMDACAMAGLNVLCLINEPTAAAIAYGIHKKGKKNVLIYDLGGGTFDVSILTIVDGLFEVKAVAGDTHLGGEDFDNRLVNHFLQELKSKHNFDLSSNKEVISRLRTSCEIIKQKLSRHSEAPVRSVFNGIYNESTITRATFEELCADLFSSTLVSVEKALCDAKLDKNQIDEIVLIGGSTRIPKVQKLLQDYFIGKELYKWISPDEAVAYGAAVQAAILSGYIIGSTINEMAVKDVTPLSLGIETDGGVMSTLIKRNTPIPCCSEEVFTTSEDNQTNLSFKVFEGERALTKDNNLLGSFEMGGISPAPRGVPQIEVTFDIDANGILNVSAKDKITKEQNKITISKALRQVEKEVIERMVSDAEKHKDEDELLKNQVDLRLEFSDLIKDLKKALARKGKKLTFYQRKKCNNALNAARMFLRNCPDAPNAKFEARLYQLEKDCQVLIGSLHH